MAYSLTELDLDAGPCDSFSDAHLRAHNSISVALPRLTQLRSLRVKGAYTLDYQLERLSALTRLHLVQTFKSSTWLRQALPQLTNLQDFNGGVWGLHETDWQEDMPVALASLAAVTRLELHAMLGELPVSVRQATAQLPTLVELSVGGFRVHCASLSSLTAVTALTVSVFHLDEDLDEDAGHDARANLARIGAATHLRRLVLQLNKESWAPLAELPHMPCLTELDVSRCNTDLSAWLPALATQLPRLRSLALTPCDDQEVSAHLAACTALTQLRLVCRCAPDPRDIRLLVERRSNGWRCLDAAELACLPSMPTLANLVLEEPAMAPPAPQPRRFMRHVAECASLRQLTLHGVNAGDSDCAVLAAARNLERVTFSVCAKDAAVAQRLCPPADSPGLAALLSTSCKVVYDQCQLDFAF